MVLKDVRAKVERGWTTTKKILAAMSVWGLVFSLVTIGRLGVAFDYDDTLVDAEKAYEKAGRSVQQQGSLSYWAVVNNSYENESVKLVPFALACALRALGFRVLIMAERHGVEGEALKKEWRRLAPRSFVFTPDGSLKHLHLQEGHYVAFFGDSDQDMLEAKKARVLALRVRRSRRAAASTSYGRGPGTPPYSPGRMGDLVVPLSQF